MATVRPTAARKQAIAAAENTAIGASATLKFYTGAMPATTETAVSGTLIATLTTSATAFGTVSGGVITIAELPETITCVAAGTIGYARLATSGGTAMYDLDVGTSGAAINLSSLTYAINDTITLNSGTLTVA